MPVIRIPDPVFERLQAIATPLVDSPASVIEKLLDFYESHERVSRRVSSVTSAQAEPSPKVASFSAEAPPDLRFTRILSAKFDGQTASNWNDLVHVAHRTGFRTLGIFGCLEVSNSVEHSERPPFGPGVLLPFRHWCLHSGGGRRHCVAEHAESGGASAGSSSSRV